MRQDKIIWALSVIVVLIFLWKIFKPFSSNFVSAEFPASMSLADAEKLYRTTIDAITMDMDAQLNAAAASNDKAKVAEMTTSGQKALSDLSTKYTEYTTKKHMSS
jgi:hypothetical protein